MLCRRNTVQTVLRGQMRSQHSKAGRGKSKSCPQLSQSILHSLFVLTGKLVLRFRGILSLNLYKLASTFCLLWQTSFLSTLQPYNTDCSLSFGAQNCFHCDPWYSDIQTQTILSLHLYLRRFSRASILCVISSSKSQIKEKESELPIFIYTKI